MAVPLMNVANNTLERVVALVEVRSGTLGMIGPTTGTDRVVGMAMDP